MALHLLSRRSFLHTTTLAALAGAQSKLWAEARRPARAPYRLIYSNDATNLTTCVSPFHRSGEPFNVTMLYASINEVNGLGVDAHFLQPGLCWVPWWKSKIYPAEEHYRWMKQTYGKEPESIGRYMLDGGDLVQAFIDQCGRVGQAPFVSFRLNDSHHKEWIDAKPGDRVPSGLTMAVSRFYHDHPEYRIGPDKNDWAQRVLNWAIPEVRAERFALIQELCENYEFAGLELDFMRYYSFFPLDRTTSEQRRTIMTQFVRDIRGVLDRNSKPGRRRRLCVRVPAFIAAHDALGIDLPEMTAGGVDMVNLSTNYFTAQHTDLAEIRRRIPAAALYNEMTNVTWTGKRFGTGYDDRKDRRTTVEQFRTTAYLAYQRGADGMSLFNFAYYRQYGSPDRGPGGEPPFSVLPSLIDEDWLAGRPQHYFESDNWSGPSVKQPLPRRFTAGRPEAFSLDVAPPRNLAARSVRFRIQADANLGSSAWEARWNGTALAATGELGEPFPAPYPQLLGRPEEMRGWSVPAELLLSGENRIEVTLRSGAPAAIHFFDVSVV